MKHYFSTILIIILLTYNIEAQTSKYQDSLIHAMSIIEKKSALSTSLLIYCIPKNDAEYLELYKLTYPEFESIVNINLYYSIIDSFYSSAKSGNYIIYKYLLEMSDYVDGEFAESYYENIESIVLDNPDLFCEVFAIIDPNKKEKLLDYYNSSCK